MSIRGQHFLSSHDIDKPELSALFATADLLYPVAEGKYKTSILDGVVIASLFFEPSTRTRLSFESAVLRLGAKCITVTGTDLVSIAKGESYADTAEVISGYSDLMVLRSSSPEITKHFAQASLKPTLNAGSGGDEHPTQALLDVYTLEKELFKRGKNLNHARITITGDLKYGRTVHSLMILLRLYEGISFHLVSPQELALPDKLQDLMKQSGHTISMYDEKQLAKAVSQSDVIYTTRIQKERFTESESQQIGSIPDEMCVNESLLNEYGKEDVVVMHPLPRDHRAGSNDLPIKSHDPRLIIFNQTRNGVPVRMALIAKVLGITDEQLKQSLSKTVLY